MILDDAIEIASSDLPHNFDEDGPHVITGPIYIDGALFYTGDPHFAQGDGEVALTALEGSLRATVRLTVIKSGTDAVPGVNDGFDMAFGETEKYWIPIGLNEDLDEAMKMSVRESIDFLSEEFSLDRALVYAYLSAGTDYEVSQVVDKTKGIHTLVEKTDFAPYITTQLQAGDSTFPVIIIDESYYVEAEPVLSALNAQVTKNGNDYTIKYDDISYEISANSNIYVTPSGSKVMDLSPIYQGDKLYIPVSTFVNIFKITLNWSSANGTVTGNLGY